MFKESVLTIWAMIIVILMAGVFAIGIYEQKNKEMLDVKRTFIDATKLYIKDHNIKVTDNLIINYEDLKKEEYVEEVKYQNKNCVADIKINIKYMIFKKYTPNITCK